MHTFDRQLIKRIYTAQKFSIKDFFSKYEQICRKLQIWSNLLKNSLMENFIFCAVLDHGTLIPRGITCKKIPCDMRDSGCSSRIVENSKIFRSYVKHF